MDAKPSPPLTQPPRSELLASPDDETRATAQNAVRPSTDRPTRRQRPQRNRSGTEPRLRTAPATAPNRPSRFASTVPHVAITSPRTRSRKTRSRSTTRTSTPSRASVIAKEEPASPPPTTTTSKLDAASTAVSLLRLLQTLQRPGSSRHPWSVQEPHTGACERVLTRDAEVPVKSCAGSIPAAPLSRTRGRSFPKAFHQALHIQVAPSDRPTERPCLQGLS
jgi:hypothetical protein